MADNDRYVVKELKRVANKIRQGIECSDCMKQCEDMSMTNSWLIMYLYENRERDVFQKDVENEFSIRRSTSSNIISLMEKKGYIDRAFVEHDARLKKLVLTPKALMLCNSISDCMRTFEENVVAGISDSELDNFFITLDKISNNLSKYR